MVTQMEDTCEGLNKEKTQLEESLTMATQQLEQLTAEKQQLKDSLTLQLEEKDTRIKEGLQQKESQQDTEVNYEYNQ